MQRLTDLVECFRVYAVCAPCGRMEPVDLPSAVERLGEESTVTGLRERVRCQHCGQRTQDIRVVYVGPAQRAAGFHYRR